MNALLLDPLHPMVVHFPIVLAVLAPVVAIGALWLGRAPSGARRPWGLVVALLLTLSVSSWVATETGEDQEDKVEAVVPEAAFETHEERAERFLYMSVAVLAIAAVGLAPGAVGLGARALATVGTLVLVVGGYQVGHSGGELVYKYGAASAYVGP